MDDLDPVLTIGVLAGHEQSAGDQLLQDRLGLGAAPEELLHLVAAEIPYLFRLSPYPKGREQLILEMPSISNMGRTERNRRRGLRGDVGPQLGARKRSGCAKLCKSACFDVAA